MGILILNSNLILEFGVYSLYDDSTTRYAYISINSRYADVHNLAPAKIFMNQKQQHIEQHLKDFAFDFSRTVIKIDFESTKLPTIYFGSFCSKNLQNHFQFVSAKWIQDQKNPGNTLEILCEKFIKRFCMRDFMQFKSDKTDMFCHTNTRASNKVAQLCGKYNESDDSRKQKVNEIDMRERVKEVEELSKYFPKNSSNNRIQWKT